ncbi:MAG: DNA polymerase I [Clostridia bacterium]|nr:DNA polymerase I [Clostridia bacterium]
MSRLLVVDGNSIMNRAFYGIMGSKMLMTKDGTYTNAVYGFLAIIFKVIDDLKPEYMAVAFDLKAPTARHKMYEGYKANRHGMPDELAAQMPIIKDVLRAMNITIIEKEGYEADDVLGTLAKTGEADGVDVTILSGDRDTFQLATDKVTIRIPRTKAGKTEEDDFDRNKVLETYGVEPKQLIEVKGLMGDTSDNIPGVPGVGEKTALNLIKEYKTIENLYKCLDEGTADSVKGKMKEKITENKELAELSRFLGTINVEVPIDEKIDDLKVKDWNNELVFDIFKELNFNRFIDRFNLGNFQEKKEVKSLFEIVDVTDESIKQVLDTLKSQKRMIYYLGKKDDKQSKNIVKKKFKSINIFNLETNEVYYIKIKELSSFIQQFKEVIEDKSVEKWSFSMNEDYVMLMENNVRLSNIFYDAEIAGYDLNPIIKPTIQNLASEYLNIDVNELIENNSNKEEKTESTQINLFDSLAQNANVEQEEADNDKYKNALFAYCIGKLKEPTLKKLEEYNSLDLFNNIEMPLVEVLAQMQVNGMFVDKNELIEIGDKLKQDLEVLTKEIHELAGEDFNINSTQQLGKILFEKLNLPVIKKTKTGYSTDVDILEKLKKHHPIIEKILEYRSLMKLNSTYVEGLLPYINSKDNRIHSFFHQTITATGRISSTEPNLQNIPTRIELGKTLRKVFKPKEGYIYIDADYSQVELRVLAHISKDENMMHAFLNDEDVHKQAASKVLGIPIDEVTKEQRSSAKAVNFGIVYGISDFGLSEQLGISRKEAKSYIEQYLEKYSGIKKFMDEIVEEAKAKGYVETLFHRRRYIPELSSNNYMVRQFGARAAMNTPIQGTAADIMKIAMINVFNQLREEKLDADIVLQVHDELILECKIDQKEKVAKLLKENMENALKMDVPLKVETSEATNWYEAK